METIDISNLQNIKAEQDVLAAVLINNDVVAELNEILEPTDFFSERHVLLYQAMKDLFQKEKPIDLTTLPEYFNNNLTAEGGFTYISNLLGSALPRFNIEHARIIKEKSNLRRLYKTLHGAVEDIGGGKSYNDILNSLQETAFNFETTEKNPFVSDTTLMTIACKAIEANYYKGGGIIGVPTGIKTLDNAINGLRSKKLYVIAGRPGMGKSALALNICQNVSKNINVAYYSLEMDEEELGIRRLAMSSLIDSTKIERGLLSDDEWVKIARNMGYISNGKCITNCKPGIHINSIRTHAKKMKLQGGLGLIIVDHIGYMDKKGMGDNLREQTSNLSLQFKNMAKEFDIPVIILSQLSRRVEERANKRPMLGDLKESGGIEENADVVMLLYRDDYYYKNSEEKNTIECNIGKQRGGRTGTVKLAWVGEFQKIGDIY